MQQTIIHSALLSILICGCSIGKSWDLQAYRRAINSGRAQLVAAAEMEKQFAKTEHMIIMYGQFDREYEWQTVSFFGGRYELSMSTTISLSPDGDTVSLIDQAKTTFYLNVVKELHGPNFEGATYHGSRALTFDFAKWEEFRQSGYDIRILDPEFDGSELPGFQEHAEASQKSRRVWR